MSDLVSVVIPIYNVEKYLDHCIESIVNQTYDNLEIILVDDGSPDMCPSICDAWAEKDNRISVIHQQNSGVAIARDVGLKASHGKYISFIDSDDWIDNDMIEYLYKLIKSGDYQISCCGFQVRRSNDEVTAQPEEQIKVYDYIDIVKHMGADHLWSVWSKLCDIDIFSNIPSDLPIISFGEDQMLMSFAYKNVDKMILSNQKKYCYFQNSESASRVKLSEKRISDILTSYEFMKSRFDKSSPAYIHFLTNYLIFNITNLNIIIKADSCWNYYDRIRKNILDNRNLIKRKELAYKIKPKHKLAVLLIKTTPKLYNILVSKFMK